MDARHCKHCGKNLMRKQYATAVEPFNVFVRREFCGHACRQAFDTERRPDDPTPEKIAIEAQKIREEGYEGQSGWNGPWGWHRYKETDAAPVETQVIRVSDLEFPDE